jgi:hypothetical protein
MHAALVLCSSSHCHSSLRLSLEPTPCSSSLH